MIKHRRLVKDPKTGKYRPVTVITRSHWSEHLAGFYEDELFHFYSEFVDEGTELRKKLLEETFIDLVKKRYVEEYLKTSPESPSVKGLQEFVKSNYVTNSEETAVAVFRKQGFKVIDRSSRISEYYSIIFEYKDGELIYDDIHADAVFDEIWSDIDLILEFVGKHIGFIVSTSKERARLFRRYLMEDAEAYPNSNEIKQRIKAIFLQLEVIELVQSIREDILEEMKLAGGSELNTALEIFVSEKFSFAFSGIVPYEDTRQTLRQPFADQYGLRLWTTLYEKAPLPRKSVERVRRFLMVNFYELFLFLVPYEISSSKRLEQDVAAGNKLAAEFKFVMTGFLDESSTSISSGNILITKGGYGRASYLITKENLSMLYADELALKEVYEKYSFSHPEIKSLFKKIYRWTKDLDEQIELENALRVRREKGLKKYLYSYEEEVMQADVPVRKLLKKADTKKVNETSETEELMQEIEKLKKEGFLWNQQQTGF